MRNDSFFKKRPKDLDPPGHGENPKPFGPRKKKKSGEVVVYELHRTFPVQSSSFLYHFICGHVEVELPNLSLPGKLA